MYFEGVNGQYKRQKTKLVGPYKCTQLFKFILILTKKKWKKKKTLVDKIGIGERISHSHPSYLIFIF